MDSPTDPDPAGGDGVPGARELRKKWEVLRSTSTSTWVMVAIVLAMLFARWLVADWTSYWYDEVLSVDVYGQWHESSIEAIRHLGERSVHPPLYQFLLYHWMELFGVSETATRTLSSSFIAVATVFLYLIAREAWNGRVGVAVAVLFSVMHIPLRYATETRSYALTICLATASSYAFLRVLRAMHSSSTVRQWVHGAPVWLLVVANAGLLFTHYYNLFFLAAQGVVFVAFVLQRERRARVRSHVVLAGIIYVIPALTFAALWGGTAVHHFGQQSERLTDDPESPVEVLVDRVVGANFDVSSVTGVVVLAVVALVVWRAARAARSRGPAPVEEHRAWVVLYTVAWLVLPLVIMFATFVALGSGRFNDRYFVYLSPALALLLVAAAHEASRWIADRTQRHTAAAVVFIAAVAMVTVAALPGALSAVSERPHDWRGLVEQTIAVIENDPEHDYIVYQSGLRADDPLLNHYFERLHPSIRVHATITRGQQRSDPPLPIEDDHALIRQHDFLVVALPHLGIGEFERALEVLDGTYERHFTQLDEHGRGLLVFRTDVEG